MTLLPDGYRDTDIAIIGMAAHLPGAGSVTAFWDNLRAGRSAIRRLSVEELKAAGESPALMRKPNYVPFAAPLDGLADFDAEFFGFSPKEAAILDPQHRQFLEVAWEAFEDAGHAPASFGGPVGVFSGCGMGSYFYFNLCSNPELVDDVGMFLLRHTGNDKDFLATRVSHILNLRGPSVNVQTACSTSLVAVHYAVQALLTGECDMALAGGVTLELPHGRGYLFKENEILSPDGACHAFDHRAQGTVFGSGAGAVVLRRLEEALADGDRILAVIRGSAINNDGAAKAGYLAPSVEGQAAAIAEAHQVAGVTADTISYVECHGTGTYLGDPIEVAALTEAFRKTTDAKGFCRIGSVKTNIGHTDTAAGVASLIKVASALHHRELPPSLGYDSPNPAIDFDTSPFLVNDCLTPWLGGPLRAGVNSLGVGGTNAHVVVQEAPAIPPSEESDWPFQPLVMSARSKSALTDMAQNLAVHLRAHPEQDLADVAFTLKNGRTPFAQRRIVVAETHEQAAAALQADDPRRVFSHTALPDPDVVFMFPGGGAQYAGMARDLYGTEPVFAEWMDRGLDYLQPKLDYDLRALWLPDGDLAQADEVLKRPSIQLPLIMITEYALAQMFIGWGAQPAALVGHSMGENTAACLAGVMGFEDCIDLVHLRGQLFDTVPAGGMLSVPLSLNDLRPFLTDDLDIASVNAPALTVVSGPDLALAALDARLRAADVTPQRVAINIAAHSRMLDPILTAFRAKLASMTLRAPQLPIISNRTGQALTDAEATDPDYWTAHLRNTVRFADCVTTLAARPNRIWLEMGPGKALSSLVRMHGAVPSQQVLSVLRHPDEVVADDIYHMGTLARIWALGGTFDWAQIWGEARRKRVQLPTYPFQRSRYFIEPGHTTVRAPALERLDDMAQWGAQVTWKPAYADTALDAVAGLSERWLVFVDDAGMAAPVVACLRAAGQAVVTVQAGDSYAAKGADHYILPPEQGQGAYARLMQDLRARDHIPTRIAHFWLVTARETHRPGSSFLHRNIEQGFLSLTHIAQALQSEDIPLPLHMTVVTSGAQALPGERLAHPEKAMINGPARVAPREMPGLTVATLDIDESALTDTLVDELCAAAANTTAILRAGKRYAQVLVPVALADQMPDLPKGAHWVITGGFGGIGLTLAETLVQQSDAKITLISRSLRPVPLPAAQVHVAAADVCNLAEMRAALDSARAALGPIHGVIHAAGHIDDAPILGKSEAAMEHVLAPKLHGVQVLDQLLPDGDVAVMVLCSSTSTVTTPVGQVDYVAANDYLNAYAASRRGDKTRVLALNWGIWQGAGMAANAMAARLGNLPDFPCDQPLFDSARIDPQGESRLSLRLDSAHWLVDQHRMAANGAAIMPGTGYVDMAAQAVRALGHAGSFTLHDLYFLRACQVPDSGARALRTTLTATGGGYALALRSDVNMDGRAGFVLNAQARVTLAADRARQIDLSAIAALCPDVTEGQGLRSPQEAHLAFGPRWRVLSRMAYGAGEGLARLDLPTAFHADLHAGHILHPALMDLATGWAMGLIPDYDGTQLWVPARYGQLQVLGPLPAQVYSHVRLRNDADAGFAAFDVTLTDANGWVLVDISAFTIKRLDSAALGADAPLRVSEIVFDAPKGATTLSAAEERLRDMLDLGITPAEGGAAFLRVLACPLDRVIVSSVALPALLAQMDSDGAARSVGATSFERPDLGSDFVAPRNAVERGLTAIWQSLLGIDQIGVEDSFFDLGGHSLIAVRLFAQIKKEWGAEFPISALFQAPTIAAIAALIADQMGIPLDDADTGAANVTPLPKAPRYTHLVPMHDGTGGPATPFFVVSGMFGNVLNLRHMALLIGRDRPFFGLQAQGLLGDQPPHDRVEDAAASMIAEIRTVQPRGPYALAGFSGGGITAYEIARQLEALGEQIEIVVLLDTPLPVRPALSRRDKVLIKLAELRRKGPSYLREWWQARQEWKRKLADGPATDAADAFHNAAIETAFRHAVGQYQVAPWSGNLVLLRPALDMHWQVSGGAWVSRQREYVHADNDWTRFAPNLRVIEVPGDHDSMVLEPNVRVLAAQLRPLLPNNPHLSHAAE
jgi:acyl transferase domain-containing protein/thioesterase domain-containing protein/acyl carrier protein